MTVFQVGLVGSMFILSFLHLEEMKEAQQRFTSYMLANQLRQSSDDLTKMARLYVGTGDERFADQFEEVLAIRMGNAPRPLDYDLVYWDLVLEDGKRPQGNGAPASLDDLMVEQGFSVEEFRILTEAHQKSDQLVQMEEIAMNAMRGRFADDSGGFTRTADPDFELARSIVFGPAYLREKAKVMTPINEFFKILDQRTNAELNTLNNRMRMVITSSLGCAVGSLAVTLLVILWFRKRILNPLALLASATEQVAKGKYEQCIEYSAGDELGSLTKAFNSMVEQTRESVEELKTSNAALKGNQIDLEREKNISESLLLNVLPAVIARRLREGETHIADEFPEVSVMFADLVNFTELSEKLGPFEIVKLLNEIFELFDHRLDDYDLEKIKTIGDCYMVVAGIPEPQADHARRIGEFALTIRDDFARFTARKGLGISLRIGIHSGTAIAGVVGTKKFTYDLWGDVVNVASRIESTGQPGRIHVSEAFMVRLKDTFHFSDHTMVELKGKGSMGACFLEGHRYEQLSKPQ